MKNMFKNINMAMGEQNHQNQGAPMNDLCKTMQEMFKNCQEKGQNGCDNKPWRVNRG